MCNKDSSNTLAYRNHISMKATPYNDVILTNELLPFKHIEKAFSFRPEEVKELLSICVELEPRVC